MDQISSQPTSTEEKHDKSDEKAGENLVSTAIQPSRDVFFRLQEIGYRKFPGLISDPRLPERLTEWRMGDAEKNLESEPPPDEIVRSRCIWAIEFYTPSQISSLLRGIRELGWVSNDLHGGYKNPERWIQQNRQSAKAGGWLNLGKIREPGTTAPFGLERSGPLPSGVEYALGSLYSLTSSLTCVVMCFALNQTHSNRFEKKLREWRQTSVSRLPQGGYRLESPASQKETEIGSVRLEISEIAAAWFRKHLPGIFASGALQGEYPTCEFLTLRESVPFPAPESHDGYRDVWLRILGIDYELNLGRGKHLPSLAFALPTSRVEGIQYHAILACKEDDLLNELKDPYGADYSSMVYHVDQHVNGLISRWALLGLLSGFERFLNDTRDSTAFDRKKRRKPIELLNDLGSYFATSVDIAVVSFELNQFAKDQDLFSFKVNPFIWRHPLLVKDEKTLVGEVLRHEVEKRAPLLSNIDGAVRDILIQYGNTIGIRENLKLQTRISTLTWVVVALTVIIAILAITNTFPVR